MARDEEIEQIKNRLRDLIDRDISSKGSQILGKENGENVMMESLFRVLHHLGYTLSVKKNGTGYDVKIRKWSWIG